MTKPVHVSSLEEYQRLSRKTAMVVKTDHLIVYPTYVAQIATELGVSLEDVASGNLRKLFDRLERDHIKGSGDNR